jgi:hypothetical protein
MPAAEYGIIVKSFWHDPTIRRKLTKDQKHLLLYLFTSPHSKGRMIGVYHLPLEYAAAEAELTVDDVRAYLAGPLAPFVSYDGETDEVFVHAFAKYNVGEDLRVGKGGEPDRRIEGVRRQVKAIHSSRLRGLFLERYNTPYRLGMHAEMEGNTSPSEGASMPLTSPSEAIAGHSTALHPISPQNSSAPRGRGPGRAKPAPAKGPERGALKRGHFELWRAATPEQREECERLESKVRGSGYLWLDGEVGSTPRAAG